MNAVKQVGYRLVAALSVLLFALPALADNEGLEGFEPYDPTKAGSDVSAPLFVVIAYSAIWLAVVVFVFRIYRKQQRLTAELAAAQARLERIENEGQS